MPSNWLFQLRLWHIRHVFLNGASLYVHEQMNLFNLASEHQVGVAVWMHVPYESSWERRNSNKILKKVALLSVNSIENVSTKSCSSRLCLQSFSHDKIEALRSKMRVEGSVYYRKHK